MTVCITRTNTILRQPGPMFVFSLSNQQSQSLVFLLPELGTRQAVRKASCRRAEAQNLWTRRGAVSQNDRAVFKNKRERKVSGHCHSLIPPRRRWTGCLCWSPVLAERRSVLLQAEGLLALEIDGETLRRGNWRI